MNHELVTMAAWLMVLVAIGAWLRLRDAGLLAAAGALVVVALLLSAGVI